MTSLLRNQGIVLPPFYYLLLKSGQKYYKSIFYVRFHTKSSAVRKGLDSSTPSSYGRFCAMERLLTRYLFQSFNKNSSSYQFNVEESSDRYSGGGTGVHGG